jgi:hypothetical protein
MPNDYPWEHLSGRINNKVINDFGTRDIWTFWARKLSWAALRSSPISFFRPWGGRKILGFWANL